MRILITGGAGFIGSAVIRYVIENTNHAVINIDKLTYAGNLESLADVAEHPRYHFEQVDICDRGEVQRVFDTHRPDAVMHLAAEPHVDRSIEGPAEFIQTNIVGTCNLLEASRACWSGAADKSDFRFHHISTDEVYGSLGESGLFTETTAYDPCSPYSASIASSDHLIRAWRRTYGLPVVVTNCSNNYGPYQFPEKLIPLMILNAVEGKKPLSVYGQGNLVPVSSGRVYDVAVNLRNSSPSFGKWVGLELSDDDHCQAWVPPGFGHGFLVLSEQTDFLYKTTDYYAPDHERCIKWDDSAIGIDWPVDSTPVVSEKDQQGVSFQNAETFL